MDLNNRSVVTEFILLVFSGQWDLQVFFLGTFSLIYVATMLGHLIVVTVTFSPTLHSPMYFFLGNLSVLDKCLSTVTMHKMITDFLTEHKTSMWCCMPHVFFMHFFGGAEMTLLITMVFAL